MRARAWLAALAAAAACAVAAFGDDAFGVKVTDAADGRPIADARVVVTAGGKDVEERTDAVGVARFTTSAPFVAVVVRAKGYVRDGTTTGPEDVEINLERGVVVEGLVVDARTGAPIVGARVTAERCDDATSGADGTFRLDGVPRNVLLSWVYAPGYAAGGVQWNAKAAARVTVRLAPAMLKPAGSVRGIVRDADGAPASAAEVVLCTPKGAAPAGPFGARTDAQGRFEIEGVDVNLEFDASARCRSPVGVAPTIHGVRAGGAVAVELRLRRPATFTARVLDPSGAPVEGAQLYLRDPEYPGVGATDADGRAAVLVPVPGTYRVVVTSDLFPTRVVPFEVAEGQTLEKVVRLAEGVAVSGLVVDDLGSPIAGAGVIVAAAREDGVGEVARAATTGADGAFRVVGLPRGACWARPYEGGHLATDGESLNAPSDGVRLVLPRRAEISVPLRVPDGVAPPRDADVAFFGDRRVQASGAWPAWRAQLDPGEWTLVVVAPGFAPVMRKVEVRGPGTQALREIVLDAGQTLHGRAVDRKGAVVPYARVTWRVPLAGREFGASADAAGEFRLEHLPPGPQDVRLVARDFLLLDARWLPDEDPETVDFHMSRGGLLRCTVTGFPEDQDARVYPFVRVVPAERADVWARWDGIGICAEGDTRLPEGRYAVVAYEPDRDYVSGFRVIDRKIVELREGETTSVELVVK